MTNNIPEGATHHWNAARTIDGGAYTIKKLGYYKFVDGKWWVYSDITNWRLSQNSDDWFTREIIEGFLKEIS